MPKASMIKFRNWKHHIRSKRIIYHMYLNPTKTNFKPVKKVVTQNYDKTVEFTKIPVASEYRQILNILEAEPA